MLKRLKLEIFVRHIVIPTQIKIIVSLASLVKEHCGFDIVTQVFVKVRLLCLNIVDVLDLVRFFKGTSLMTEISDLGLNVLELHKTKGLSLKFYSSMGLLTELNVS